MAAEVFSPICSTMSGGKTREAKALRKMAENSRSRPPMPIFSKFHSGLCGGLMHQAGSPLRMLASIASMSFTIKPNSLSQKLNTN
ncbi:hypothetical protein EYF80_044564 [Liparis tanakae]|uniref:Uncharacterized protein n=1 Tax=Liparis tanakae TaxID=230148 RepID=A0A4Z2FWF7_9TELE|nr:hypothetical protein EYF80_044564 [Liparis tanakae]